MICQFLSLILFQIEDIQFSSRSSFLFLLLLDLVFKQFKQTLSKAPTTFQVLSFASYSLFCFVFFYYHWLSLSSYLLWSPSIHNLRRTYPWVNVIRDSRVFDGGLLSMVDFKISKRFVLELTPWKEYWWGFFLFVLT